jgi:Flp pilus assembly protein TadG
LNIAKTIDGIKPAHRERSMRLQQRGATIIEASVILVPFLAIFFALFDFGMAIFMKNTMQFAVRQGVRYAITSQTGTGLGQDASINAVINQNSFGFLPYLGSGPANRTCTGTVSGSACVTISYFQQTIGSPPTLNQVTGAGSNAQGNVVQILVTGLAYNWMAPLLRTSTPLSFSVASAGIMEAQPNGPPTR